MLPDDLNEIGVLNPAVKLTRTQNEFRLKLRPRKDT
jgi:hypothetical protein